MRSMTTGILVLAVLVLTAWPAGAGDEGDKAKIAALEAKVARQAAELAQLRAAYDQQAANGLRLTRSLGALTNSINASRDMIKALTQTRDKLQQDVRDLRAMIVKRPNDDPARLKLALRDEQARHATDVARLQERIHELSERHDKMVIRATTAENKLAQVKEQLAEAKATIERLRAGK